MPSSSSILEAFLDTNQKHQADSLLQVNQEHQGRDFLSSLDYYLQYIVDSDESLIAYEYLIPYMSPERKKKLLSNVQIAHLLLRTETQYEEKVHKNTENAAKYAQLEQRCLELIELLTTDYLQFVKEQERVILTLKKDEELLLIKKKLQVAYQYLLDKAAYDEERKECRQLLDYLIFEENQTPEQGQCSDGMPVKYLGIKLAELRNLKASDLIELLNAINYKRLYWVWGGGFVKLLLEESLAPDFFGYDAKDTAHFPDPYTGCMSWALYFFRLFLHSRELVDRIRHPRSEEEKAMSWQERGNWLKVKYPILNDLLWGWANFFSFFWSELKVGKEGYLNQIVIADLLTTILLVFDAAMALWEYSEQKAIFDDNVAQFDSDIQNLERKIAQSHSAEEKNQYEMRLENTKREKAKCINDFHLQYCSLVINIIYTLGLFLAFSLVAFGGSASGLVLLGTVLCFAFTVLNNAAKNAMEVYSLSLSLNEAKTAILEKTQLLLEPNIEENERKYLFLELKGLKAETEYQQALVSMQTIHFFRSLLLEAFLVPAAIFLPLGISVYPAIFAVVGVSNAMVNRLCKPEKEALTSFEQNQDEYKECLGNPEAWLKKPKTSPSIFFSCFRCESEESFGSKIPQPV